MRVAQHSVWLTLFASIFMHGGWVHIVGNMLFLWIFGNNVEDRMGRWRYALFYLVCGVIAALTQLATDPSSGVPNIGASGAIAGVLGAYIVLYPRARVLTAITLLVFFAIVEVPAILLLGAWFLLQVLDGSAGLVDRGSGRRRLLRARRRLRRRVCCSCGRSSAVARGRCSRIRDEAVGGRPGRVLAQSRGRQIRRASCRGRTRRPAPSARPDRERSRTRTTRPARERHAHDAGQPDALAGEAAAG